MHVNVRRFAVAVCLTLCVGLQVLEATGRWDYTFQDSQDEAVVVALVLCVGATIAIARARQRLFALRAVGSSVRVDLPARRTVPRAAVSPLHASPPLALRV